MNTRTDTFEPSLRSLLERHKCVLARLTSESKVLVGVQLKSDLRMGDRKVPGV